MTNCLDNFIGLTRNDCACFEGDKPVDFDSLNESLTGYYITDSELGFPMLEEVFNTIDCGLGSNIFDVLLQAREDAIRDFYKDLRAAIHKTYRNRFKFDGSIGRIKSSSSLSISKSKAGLELIPGIYRDGKLTIRGIYVGLKSDATVTLNIESNDPEFTPQTLTGAVVANNWTKLEPVSPIELPFYSKLRPDGLKYFVYYDYPLPGGAAPINNDFRCCGNRKVGYENYLRVGGFSADDLPNEDLFTGNTTRAYGLVLDSFLTCDETDWLCRIESAGGYSVQGTVGAALNMKAAAKVISSVLQSNRINFFTSKPKEELWGRRRYLNGEYSNNVLFLAENLPPDIVSCFDCKDSSRFKRKFIKT
jgi:hypothetical protein